MKERIYKSDCGHHYHLLHVLNASISVDTYLDGGVANDSYRPRRTDLENLHFYTPYPLDLTPASPHPPLPRPTSPPPPSTV